MKPENKLILRDSLAIGRSKLANERTLLAYIRTGLMFFVSGLSLIKLFSDDIALVYFGRFIIPLSVCLIIWSIYRFIITCKSVKKLYSIEHQNL
ncbi:MAG TPA: DUF202 domain-containing protein [Arcobacter sp.]|nr:DUF202 domain-containing protein [Arcobacter sp.]